MEDTGEGRNGPKPAQDCAEMTDRPGEVTHSCRFARPNLQRRVFPVKGTYIPNPVDWNSLRKIMAAIRKPSSVTVSAVIMMVRSWPSTGLSNWAIR
jgi:hypothetical protein